jgi:hypothetical protein
MVLHIFKPSPELILRLIRYFLNGWAKVVFPSLQAKWGFLLYGGMNTNIGKIMISLCFFQGEEQIRQAELIKSKNSVIRLALIISRMMVLMINVMGLKSIMTIAFFRRVIGDTLLIEKKGNFLSFYNKSGRDWQQLCEMVQTFSCSL